MFMSYVLYLIYVYLIYRDWKKFPSLEHGNVLIVTHGLTLRLFLMVCMYIYHYSYLPCIYLCIAYCIT